jgi:hypothetical protein
MSQESLEGFLSAYQDALPGSESLPDVPCDAVLISNWNVGDDKHDTGKNLTNAPNTDVTLLGEIYWGFDGKPAHQLFISQMTPFLIPVSNANQISIRCSANAAKKRIHFSLFRKKRG